MLSPDEVSLAFLAVDPRRRSGRVTPIESLGEVGADDAAALVADKRIKEAYLGL